MNLLTLILQFVFEQETRKQAERLREAGLRAAETGRRVAISVVFYAAAGIFFFAGLLVGVIELGLQIDRQLGIAFSGLMVSTSLLILIGLLCVLAGWLVGRIGKPPMEQPQAAPAGRRSELRDALEEVAVMFIREFQANQKAARGRAEQPPAQEN